MADAKSCGRSVTKVCFSVNFSLDVIALASKAVQYLVIAIPYEVNLCLFNR